jgi:GT2 family glycosyltransferase
MVPYNVIDALCAAAALPVLVVSGYLGFLALLSWRARAPRPAAPHLRFDIVVPAHDEERGISRTVRSLLSVDYPAELRRVVVVADNCSDATAERAAAAGARVLVRNDPGRTGKGYALDAAFSWSLADGFADAAVVVDADTVASPGLLHAFAARLERGAGAVQARNGVQNPEAGWRTRLMAIAFALFNEVRSISRERLRLSCGLRGNGMCISTALLREVPYGAFSVVEDLEYGIQLGLAGHRVWYAGEAGVASEMVASEAASRSQRRRWEGGRRRLRRDHGAGLLSTALRRHDPVLLDLAADVLVPPLSLVAIAAGTGLALTGASSVAAGRPLVALYAWGASCALVAGYVVRGWAVSGTGLQGLADLLYAPVFVAWKVALALHDRLSPHAWVRTAREGEAGTGHPAEPGGPGSSRRGGGIGGWTGSRGRSGAGAAGC